MVDQDRVLGQQEVEAIALRGRRLIAGCSIQVPETALSGRRQMSVRNRRDPCHASVQASDDGGGITGDDVDQRNRQPVLRECGRQAVDGDIDTDIERAGLGIEIDDELRIAQAEPLWGQFLDFAVHAGELDRGRRHCAQSRTAISHRRGNAGSGIPTCLPANSLRPVIASICRLACPWALAWSKATKRSDKLSGGAGTHRRSGPFGDRL